MKKNPLRLLCLSGLRRNEAYQQLNHRHHWEIKSQRTNITSHHIMGDCTFIFLWIFYSHPNTYLNSFHVFLDPMFCNCILIKFLYFSYSYVFALRCSKGGLNIITSAWLEINGDIKMIVYMNSVWWPWIRLKLPLSTKHPLA